MGDLIRKSHNVSLLMYHIVCVATYRRLVITDEVDSVLKSVCIEISKRYEIRFLVQSVPTYSPTMIAAKIKSITARKIFAKVPSVKKELWGGEFWTDGYFVSTVSEHANEDVIRHYVRNQGRVGEYKLLHKQNVVHHE